MSLIIPENMRFRGVEGFVLPDLDKAEPVLSSFARWKKQRLGRITGSQFVKCKIAKSGKNKGGLTDGAKTYMDELLAELLTGKSQDDIRAKALQWGIDHEPLAIADYEKKERVKINKSIFRLMPGTKLIGCTADGFVSNDGVVEVKCPYYTKNHVRTIVTKQVPAKYKDQVNGHLLCTGRQWCDFVSYDPRCKVRKIVVIRVWRDEDVLQELKERLLFFQKEYKQQMKKVGVSRKVKLKPD